MKKALTWLADCPSSVYLLLWLLLFFILILGIEMVAKEVVVQ
jgi:hypothetical protein